MEGRKESKYNLAGICANCGKPVKIELTIATELIETNEGKGTEGKDNDGKTKIAGVDAEVTESGDIRPADAKGPAGTKDSVPEPTDSGKSKADKRSGGKTK